MTSLKTTAWVVMLTTAWTIGEQMMRMCLRRKNAYRNVCYRSLLLQSIALMNWGIAKKKGKSSKTKPAPPPPVAPTINDYRPKPSAQSESDFMASLMGSMTNIAPDTSKTRKRKPRSPSPVSSPASHLSYRKTVTYQDTSSDGFSEDLGAMSSDYDVTSPADDVSEPSRRRSRGGTSSTSGGSSSSTSARRREQNRLAQRALRQRRETHIRSLEDRILHTSLETRHLASENQDLMRFAVPAS